MFGVCAGHMRLTSTTKQVELAVWLIAAFGTVTGEATLFASLDSCCMLIFSSRRDFFLPLKQGFYRQILLQHLLGRENLLTIVKSKFVPVIFNKHEQLPSNH